MQEYLYLILILMGLVVLVYSAEVFINGLFSVAKRLNISEFFAGIVFAAIGVSLPELIIMLKSNVEGAPDIGIGAVLGSNILNLSLILGLASVYGTVKLSRKTIWKEIPLAGVALLGFLVAASDTILESGIGGVISRGEAFLFLALLFLSIYYIFDKKTKGKIRMVSLVEYDVASTALMLVLGFVMLYMGGNMVYEGAIRFSAESGMSLGKIGLFTIALGTAAPELVTTVYSMRKGYKNIAIGSLVGSVIFNTLWVSGISGVIFPVVFNPFFLFDIFINALFIGLLFLSLFIGKKHVLEKWQGIFLIGLYVLYVISVFVR